MVCEKVADSDFDFTKDGLRLSVDGDLLSPTGQHSARMTASLLQ